MQLLQWVNAPNIYFLSKLWGKKEIARHRVEDTLKYNPKKDIPKYARRYKTVNPSKLAPIISMERKTKITSKRIRSWLGRNPDIHKELTKYVDEKLAYEAYLNQIVLAELYVDNFRDLQITDLETLNLAYRYLGIIEEDLKIKICKNLNLKITKR